MAIGRRDLLKLGGAAVFASGASSAFAAAPAPSRRIIDVHMHAYPAATAFENPIVNPITGARSPIRNGAEHMEACIAEMKRWNVVKGVVSGGDGDRLKAATDWVDRDPTRFLAGAGVRGSDDTPLPPLDTLRKAFADGRIKVLGEVTSQYAGLTLGDAKYDPYLALAEAFDIPVALHTGSMPGGTTFDPCCRTARARLGNPEYVEEALNKHPKLRLNLMHAGWPYLQETISILMVYPNVNVDTGAMAWLLPRPAFHDILGQLVKAGFGKRVMFGSDHMFWPDAIGLSVQAIETAPFLTEEQKQDIFFNNAATFYKIAA
ncbi:MAG: amidohydrolase family protein [Caulobacter sp.]|nr:amidohydrolase family protein [Caulobacter sp.]